MFSRCARLLKSKIFSLSLSTFSAPHVAGAAALILGANPTFSADQVENFLLSEAVEDVITDVKGSPNKLLHVDFNGAACNSDADCNDESNPCATGTCNSGTCANVANDNNCPSGQVCDETQGCVTPSGGGQCDTTTVCIDISDCDSSCSGCKGGGPQGKKCKA